MLTGIIWYQFQTVIGFFFLCVHIRKLNHKYLNVKTRWGYLCGNKSITAVPWPINIASEDNTFIYIEDILELASISRIDAMQDFGMQHWKTFWFGLFSNYALESPENQQYLEIPRLQLHQVHRCCYYTLLISQPMLTTKLSSNISQNKYYVPFNVYLMLK